MREWLLIVGMVSSSALGLDFDAYDPPSEGKVRIVRDMYGVPHVIAADERSLFYGAGYAQAEDQLENMCKNYLRAAGRIAEHEGAASLPLDHAVRLFKLRERAEKDYEQIDREIRVHFDAFAAGVNAYIGQHRKDIPAWIEPVTPYDVVAFSMYVDVMFSVSHCREDLKQAGIQLGWLDTLLADRDTAFGSNQFAVSPKRSATGAAMLSMDPHLRLSGFYRWYEMHLICPGYNMMGAVFFGLPYSAMGRTAGSAWCMTVNKPDLGDVFVFEVNPENPKQIKGLEGWESVDLYEETYKILADGKLIERKMPCLQTTVGPVMAKQDGKVFAFSIPRPESLKGVRQLWDMARATNLNDFKKALKQRGLVMFNIAYANADGDIFYISNGRVPIRDERIDSGEVRPGDQAWARWQGFHPTSELPQIANPEAGYVLNCNSGPQNALRSSPLQPDRFPSYMMGHVSNSRQRRLLALVDPDESVTWEEMRTYASDTHIELADEWVPKIVNSIRHHSNLFSGDVKLLQACAEVLAAWDRRTDVTSRGAILFDYLAKDSEFKAAMEIQGLAMGISFQAMNRQASIVSKKFGRLDEEWGAFSRIRRGDIELGCAGSGDTGGAALRPTRGPIVDGKRQADRGSSYHMIVDFSGETRAISCLPFGVSEDTGSPHFADQMASYARGQYKPAWFLPEEIKANVKLNYLIDFK
jgi:acyl-homoserine lactone acylase PvdQ